MPPESGDPYTYPGTRVLKNKAGIRDAEALKHYEYEARAAGYEFDQTRIDNSNQQWNQAAERSFYGDLAPVKLIFAEAIRPARVLPFDKLP